MYQAPYADWVRNEVGIATMTVGAVTTPDQVNTLLAAGKADLVALARPHLANPYFTLRPRRGISICRSTGRSST
jgi:anthraniloyl-CoA monooxygenase